MPEYSIVPVGDAALFVEFADRLDTAINARVVWLADRIRLARIVGVRDVVPAYRSVAVYFDPLRTHSQHLTTLLEAAAETSREAPVAPSPVKSVPVCYGGPMGPDLEEVARATGLTPQEVVSLHAEPTYHVFMIGFTPGFAYMGPVDRRIALPRRMTPRLRVSAGSVAIAGEQTGIYPSETPGGWHVIGRTPLRPFRPQASEPFALKAGDAVRFQPIAVDEYDRLIPPVTEPS